MQRDLLSCLTVDCGLDPAKPVIAGISGGPDSLYLLDMLRKAGYKIVVAHFNHKLRPESNEDARFVQTQAEELKVPFVLGSADVAGYADEHSLSVEEAARILRYKFLLQTARKHRAQAVAVGHTADDQAETVLMHLLRGAGLKGLCGMSYRTVLQDFDPEIPIVRPMLDTWREEVVFFCASRGLRPRYDPSNTSPNYLRNRLRHILIPALESYNPRIREALWRMAHTLGGDYEILTEVLDSAWGSYCQAEGPGYVTFSAAALSRTSAGLRRNLLRRALEHVRPGLQNVDFAVLERADACLTADGDISQLDLTSGVRLLMEGERVYVAAWEADLPKEDWPQIKSSTLPMRLTWPGTWAVARGWTLKAERWQFPALAWEQAQHNENPFQTWLDIDRFTGALSVRTRRPGDRFLPLGMANHAVKLSDFFINAKLPRRARSGWPLVCDGETIAWIPGFRPAHPYRLRQDSRNVLYLALMRSQDE